MQKKLEYYLKKARKEKWAIGQFNFSELPQMEGIIEAAKKLQAPIILGTSEGESRFIGLKQAVALKNSYQAELGLPIFLNLDHGKSFDYIKKAIDVGYDMVHFDGSKLPLEENIALTKEVVKYAGKYGILVEGEVGVISTDASRIYAGKFELKPEDLTKPEDSRQYIKDTAIDLLAISIGNFHGMDDRGNPPLNLKRLKEIKKVVGETGLVLHGGSGISAKDIKAAIRSGIVKININTELRVAYTETLKETLEKEPKEITPYKYLPQSVKAVEKVAEEKIKLFGSKNKI